MTDQTFQSNGFNLQYTHQGSGKTRLVFIHGFCGYKEVWESQQEKFSKDYEVIAPDLLSFGESSKCDVKTTHPENIKTLKTFLTSLPPKPTVLLGHSWGGGLIAELANEPNVTALIFVDSPALVEHKDILSYREFGAKIFAQADPMDFICNHWIASFVTEKCPKEIRAKLIAAAAKVPVEFTATFMGNFPKAPTQVPEKPCLVVEGAFFPEGNSMSWLRFFPKAAIWRTPERSHYFFYEDPQPFNDALEKFLNER